MYFRAEKALNVAQEALNKEAIARSRAEQAEKAAKEKSEELRRTLYVNSIQLADAKYGEANIRRVRALLESCPNDLRGWEWYRLNHVSDQASITLNVREGRPSASFSPDGKRIVSGSVEGTIKLWDASTGRELMALRGHSAGVGSPAFSPDGKLIVSGSADKTVKVWDARSGKELMTLSGHSDLVTSVAFSPDGKRIISGSWDKTIKIWDAVSGRELLTLRGHESQVLSVAFSPDGKRIISCCLWDK
ncbi:unnamed protein product, partial [marine sediment metagenome]